MGEDSWTQHKSSVDKLCTTLQHQTSVITGLIYVESQTDITNIIGAILQLTVVNIPKMEFV